MFKLIKPFIYTCAAFLLLAEVGCKKGSFDINSVNPNVPSDVSPKFILSGALAYSANIIQDGANSLGNNQVGGDFAGLYMGYLSVSGDYIPVTSTLTYQTTTGYYFGEWDYSYLVLKNYRQMEVLAAADPNAVYYSAIAKIMEALHFVRLVDMYNNIPYTQALQGGTIDYPKYDSAQTVYAGSLAQLDTAIALIANAPATAENPGNYDIMFGGNMTLWTQLANTLILKTVMNLTQYSGGPAIITAALNGMTSASFLGVGQDATVNPGYTNASNTQQSPFYQDFGYATSGAVQNNESYLRACTFAVNYMYGINDTLRLYQIYGPATATGVVAGRPFGSEQAAGQDNQHISGMGPGTLQGPSASAVILPAFESLFLQAEATQRGYLPGGPSAAAALYQQAVEESFRILLVSNSQAAADNFITSSTNPDINITLSSNPIQTIIMGEWLACNGIDDIQSWNNWKRLGIPSNLPISVFAGTTAAHVPYRLLYSQTEFQFNSANVATQNVNGYPDNINDKIFWMP